MVFLFYFSPISFSILFEIIFEIVILTIMYIEMNKQI